MNTSERFTVLSGGTSAEERTARLVDGADEATEGQQRPSLLTDRRFLLAVSGALMAGGVLAIILGWAGASNSTVVEEQVPYLISGGLLGVALALIGAITFFSHWLTVSIRESRTREAARQQDHEELMEALRALAGSLPQPKEPRNGRARSPRS